MSRSKIADALARTEYGEAPDEVDHHDRLHQVDALLASGTVIDVDELLTGPQQVAWHSLASTLQPLGWVPVITWLDQQLDLWWVPPYADQQAVEAGTAPRASADDWPVAGVSYWPPYAPGDRDLDPITFPTAAALLDWLSTPDPGPSASDPPQEAHT